MLARYKVPMPNQNLSDAEVREYIAYFKWADANLRPQVAKQPQSDAPATTKLCHYGNTVGFRGGHLPKFEQKPAGGK